MATRSSSSSHLLPQIVAIWAKLSGYKGSEVSEQRTLVAGRPNPQAHMQLLGEPTTLDSFEPETIKAYLEKCDHSRLMWLLENTATERE
jgi:hypothetical protein